MRLASDAGAGTVDIEVEKHLNRISDGILAEDRREALQQLKELLQDSPQVVKVQVDLKSGVYADQSL